LLLPASSSLPLLPLSSSSSDSDGDGESVLGGGDDSVVVEAGGSEVGSVVVTSVVVEGGDSVVVVEGGDSVVVVEGGDSVVVVGGGVSGVGDSVVGVSVDGVGSGVDVGVFAPDCKTARSPSGDPSPLSGTAVAGSAATSNSPTTSTAQRPAGRVKRIAIHVLWEIDTLL
jgi:hypothetical protein